MGGIGLAEPRVLRDKRPVDPRQVSDSQKRIAHLVVLMMPLAGVAAAIVLLWNRAVGWSDMVLLFAMYLYTGLGVTMGYHRLFTHRSFATHRWVEASLAIQGSMALQGSVIDWVSDHRKHHAMSDQEGDPHSPHHGESLLGGLWHAHAGWLFHNQGRADRLRYAPELMEDPIMRAIDRGLLVLMALSLAIPFGLGYLLTGQIAGAVTGLVWGGLVRMFLFDHSIFAVNSLCHYYGERRYATGDESRNSIWLSSLTLGESWHNNHHAFPRSASHGLRRMDFDFSGLVIRMMERLGLAWNVIRISEERQRERLVEG